MKPITAQKYFLFDIPAAQKGRANSLELNKNLVLSGKERRLVEPNPQFIE